MPIAMRALGLIAVCGLALACTACSSNNTGKIEGKWKLVSAPSKDSKGKDEFDAMNKMGVYLYFEFKSDQSLVIGIGADDPKMLDLIKSTVPGQKVTWMAKYKLMSGDKVEVYDVKDEEFKKFMKGEKGRSDITIVGDDMTIKDPDGSTSKLVRMK
jgi:hypothetical protein